jgi:hypothetical protein
MYLPMLFILFPNIMVVTNAIVFDRKLSVRSITSLTSYPVFINPYIFMMVY